MIRAARLAALLGTSQAFFWGIQHPFQQPVFSEIGGEFSDRAQLALLTQFIVFPCLIALALRYARNEDLIAIWADRKRLLALPGAALFSVCSFYLYSYGQYLVGSGGIIAIMIAVSPVYAYVLSVFVDKSWSEISNLARQKRILLKFGFHLALAIVVFGFLMTANGGSFAVDISTVIIIMLVPAFYYGAFFLIARYYYWLPPEPKKLDRNFYISASLTSALFGSICGTSFSVIYLLLSGDSLLPRLGQVQLSAAVLFALGALSIGVVSMVIFIVQYTTEDAVRERVPFYYHLTPIFSALAAFALPTSGDENLWLTLLFAVAIVALIIVYDNISKKLGS